MLSHIVEWGAAVLAAGVVAGLVVLVGATAGAWWLYRRLRRRVEAYSITARRYALRAATVAVAARQGRLPPQVVNDLRRRINGPPEVW